MTISAKTTEKVIPFSKTKVVLLTLVSVALVAGGVWLWSIADQQNRQAPFLMRTVAIAGILCFGSCTIYGCYKFFDNRPGLVIDSQGIIDNSSAVAVGRVFWREIIDIRESSITGQRFVSIEVIDPEIFIRQSNFLIKMLNAANLKLMGTPINISANSLWINFDELVQMLVQAYEEAQGTDQSTDENNGVKSR